VTEVVRKISSKLDKWLVYLIVFAVAYGCVLALNLAYKSMMWDEVTHFTGGLLLSRGQFGLWVWTNSFYPPIFDFAAAFYYLIGGPSVFAGRLVAVTFSVLSVFMVYAIAKKLYNGKTALVAGIFFGVMPGIVWLSRMAMIETMLIFIFCVAMLFFFRWLQTGTERDRIISITAVAIGAAVKYQMLVVVPLIMLFGMYFWKREYLKTELRKWIRFPRLLVILAAIAAVAAVAYVLFASGLADTLLYAIQVGTADKAVYSVRYPTPIFYFIEMTWSSTTMHPVSLLLYLMGLVGLGWLTYKRRQEDRFLLLWFAVVFLVFTLIPNREWRYVTVAFPVLAIAAASLLTASFDKLGKIRQTSQRLGRKWGTRLAAVALIALTSVGVVYSCVDAYTWVANDQIQVPVEQATNYASQGLMANQTLVVACPVNRFNRFMIWFYLNIKNPNEDYNQTWQYPQLATDAYTPNFNVSEFAGLCQERNVKYVLIYEFSGIRYFNSTLTQQQVCSMLNETGRFTIQATFGIAPERIFVLSFS
jgi:4-amino-4-deoxy-L-arabinose transferase-like glycosyltransferase